MPLTLTNDKVTHWDIRKIAVIGPGIVGMPMAAMLAHVGAKADNSEPAEVVVVQRASKTSGWKVTAINEGRSPIGGVEPELDDVVKKSVADKRLRATSDYSEIADADVVLVCVQTDRCGPEPDYGPMFSALGELTRALQGKPAGNVPLVVFESTLAPSSMATVIREFFAAHGLHEGKDVLLGNSPNRVMPGRLVERVRSSDKLVAGLHAETPELIHRLYSQIVTEGELHRCNSLTAEIVKTLENAYRDVRIAFATELVRYCDDNGIDYYALREKVNQQVGLSDAATRDPNAVPSGGLLIPMLGVGGHCLPKDGILLWWRALEAARPTAKSLILQARHINDESPLSCLRQAEAAFGSLINKRVALLGAAYRFNSEDTRNSPTLELARHLQARGADVRIHDPHVYPTDKNLAKYGLASTFSRELEPVLDGADAIFVCTAHREYLAAEAQIMKAGPVYDGCNAYQRQQGDGYTGIGRGQTAPSAALVEQAARAFAAVERGVANEVAALVDFLNERYASDDFTRVRYADVQRIAGTCVTGCRLPEPGPVTASVDTFTSRLLTAATG